LVAPAVLPPVLLPAARSPDELQVRNRQSFLSVK